MTNDSIDNIRLDINHEKVNAAVYCRQGDTKTRTIHCTLADNGNVVDLSNAILVEILIKKADGYECDNGCVVVGNEIQYTLRTNDIAADGDNVAQFMVTFDDNSVITSPEFHIWVYKKTLNQKTQQSLNDYSAITDQLVMAKKYKTEAEASKNSAATSEEVVASYVETISSIRDEVAEYEASASASKSASALSEENAKASEDNAKASEENVASMVSQAQTSEQNALAYRDTTKGYMDTTEGYKDTAATYDATYQGYVAEAESSKNSAKVSETNAKTSETNAKTSEDNSQDYYDKTYELYQKIGGGTLVLGETSTTAHRGDHGVIAYNHSQITSGNPHGTTYTDVGADASGSAAASYSNATAYTDQKIADLINGAPETLDTLKEIADAMASSEEVVEALEKAIGEKANESEFSSHENNTTIHMSSAEKTELANATSHIADTTVHITSAERTSWNSLVSKVNLLTQMIGYPIDPTSLNFDSTEGE